MTASIATKPAPARPDQLSTPTTSVLRIAQVMASYAVTGTPRNYELFHAAMSGEFGSLQQELKGLGRQPPQSILDLLYAKHIMQSRIEAIVEDAPRKLEGTLSETMDLMRKEQNSLSSYQRILSETSKNLKSEDMASDQRFGEFIDVVSNATSATLEHGRGVMSAMSAKSAELDNLKKKLDEYKTLADKDALTGLWNRRAFDRLCSGLGTGQGKQGAFVLLDIDHFKRLNDTYGHPFGDTVIRRVGAVLQNNLRKGTLTFRAGGEEYAVFLDKTPHDVSVAIANRLNAAVAAEDFSDGEVELKPGDVTISIGICFQDRATNGQELYSKADEALYKSKQSGRNRVTVYAQNGDTPGDSGQLDGPKDDGSGNRNWYLYR